MSGEKTDKKREEKIIPKAAKKPKGGKDEMSMAKEDIADISAWLSASNVHEGVYDKTLAALDKGFGAVPDEDIRARMSKASDGVAEIETKEAPAPRRDVQKNARGYRQDAQMRKKNKNYSKV